MRLPNCCPPSVVLLVARAVHKSATQVTLIVVSRAQKPSGGVTQNAFFVRVALRNGIEFVSPLLLIARSRRCVLEDF